MKMIPLAEFQRITQLSDRALVWLIKQPQIEMEIDPKKGLLIAPDSANTHSLIAAIASQERSLAEEKRALIIERLASIVDDGLDDIVEVALARLISKQG